MNLTVPISIKTMLHVRLFPTITKVPYSPYTASGSPTRISPAPKLVSNVIGKLESRLLIDQGELYIREARDSYTSLAKHAHNFT